MKRKIIITMKNTRRLTTFCLTGALTLAASGGALASGNDAALQALFAQANYWHEKSHDELAMESLQKVLSVDANNTQALYLMALWSQQGGDMQAAAQWRARLAKAAPDSPGLQDLDNAKKMSQVPQGQLNLARQQARGGNIPGALATWRSMFNGNTPPAGLAAEYYLTMASDKSLYPQAISELRQYVAQHPQENAPRVALGKALTWREETRREGIALLEPMASGNKEADSGLRQALLWLGPQAGDEQYYDTWMQRHPQDSEVQNYFRERRSGQARGQGYANLNSGNTAAAKQQFEEVLQTNPQDADALAGMGYIAQRSGDYQAASQYLSRAADLGGDASATRRQQAADALFYGQLAQAQQAYKQGNISQALALSAPLAQQSGAQGASAKLFRADVLRHNKDLPQAEQTLRSLLNDDPQNAAARENLYYVLREQNKSAEAQNLISNPQLQASSTPTQLASIRNGYVINEADRLREQGNYAAAYDKLIRAMQSDPQNTDLMFAMARLYQSGKMNKEAGVVYDYLMTRDTPNQDARAGAIDVALSAGNNDRAEQLAGGLRQDNSPDRLLLLARVAEAQGHHQQAMTYLRSARGKLLGMQSTNSSETPTVGGVLAADNPFIGVSQTSAPTRTASAYGQYMPWQVAQSAAAPGSTLPGIQRTDLPVDTAQTRMLRQVDTMMESLQEKTGSWLQGGMDVRGRDGESGTSKLTELRTPLTWSSSPFGDSRFDFTVTPVSLNAGTASGDAWRRYGANPLANAVSNMVSTATSEQAAIASMTEAERTAYFASNPGAEALSGLGTLNAADFNPTTSSGMENLAKLGSYDAGQVASYLSSSSRKPNVDQTSGSTDSQKANGVELALALSGDDYRVDIGSTPLGQDLNTVVGGVKWSPKLTNYLSLILTGERRSLTDSLLSYVGLKDAYSGKTWGQVTKNGGTLQLSYDDGDAGFYVGGGGYSYLGQNVASNTSINANAGVYLRPYHDEYRQLQAGLSMSYMDYSKNLSYFTYGQGGYFSPQNYVSVSLPVSLTEKYDNWTMKLGGSVGYQSYSQDKSAYFPTNSEWQQTLETAVSNGFAKEAYYSATSKSGIGYTLRAGADYKVNKQMTLGGQIGYDTFGDYNESTAGLYIRYMLGEH
ncbi:cellulose biosynthesis protein BcsC [Klebsiella pneumoniae]|uniref:cellulose biosynthesis protein BcsC n=1 Tax=Klebsiella pneumoniae TaxID=573 RepID=UPI000DF16AE3|nr:cellulose biosynthesis protein BcsC [Klebsiella pneumoniae]MBD1315105.1 BCSC C-terminal domain-containing protein [Klebsiella pneumoniae]MDH8606631.1 cellulose synthase subunit BcsC-related outer membrane protein [Klebsiella pneumoniae]MDH8663034.1 cellulose synthase subunit BcsC-related outer membrane protein [Klebsiella pneumoniae]RCR78774.1 cellulose synthase [Klebsiella pneumoniae]RCR88813.1 cellulose synthase [Klebsiella pneumoniae]